MKISERSVAAFAKIVTGASKILPSRSGPALVRLFNEFGANDVYSQGFPNGPTAVVGLICEILDPRDWREF